MTIAPVSNGFSHTYQTASVKDWCQRHNAPFHVKLPERPGLTYGPWYGPDPGVAEPINFNQPEAYLAEVSDCHVLGGVGVVIQGEEALLDIALGNPRFDLSSPLLPMVNRERIIVEVGSISEDTITEGILLQSFFASNYHHWMVEHLPKLLLLDDVPSRVPLLVDSSAMAIPQMVAALRAVTERPVISLDWGVLAHVEKLYVPSNLFWTGPNLKRGLHVEVGDVLVSREAIEWLRAYLAPTEPGRRRIYVDRQAVMAPVRLRNGVAVQQVFAEFGFETVRPAEMTFTEQLDVFGDAAYIAGESGAAMTNVLLAPSSAIMICMQAQRWPLNIYADLATYSGQRNLFIVGDASAGSVDEAGGHTYQAAFTVDPDSLRDTLSRILVA